MALTLHRALTSLLQLPLLWWFAALGLFCSAQLLLICRWRLYLTWLGATPGLPALVLIYLQGWAFLLTPVRSGELVRVRLLRRRCGVPTAVGLAVLLAERCTGLASALILLGIGIAGSRPLLLLTVAVCIASLLWLFTHPSIVFYCRLRLPRHPNGLLKQPIRMAASVLNAMSHLRQLLTPQALAIGIGMAGASWLLESLLVWSFWRTAGSFGDMNLGLLQAAVIRVSLGLGAVLSMLPAGLGISDGTVLGVALVLGMSSPLMLATLLIIRFFTVALPLSVGALAWLIPRRFPSLSRISNH